MLIGVKSQLLRSEALYPIQVSTVALLMNALGTGLVESRRVGIPLFYKMGNRYPGLPSFAQTIKVSDISGFKEEHWGIPWAQLMGRLYQSNRSNI